MSWFKRLFRPRVERQLQGLYEQMLEAGGSPRNVARQIAQDMIDEAVERSRAAGTYDMPLNQGDRLLALAQTDEGKKQWLAELRADGVTDEDIRSWWNQHDVSRRMLLVHDEMSRIAAVSHDVESGFPLEAATARARRLWPRFGRPVDDKWGAGDHRPIPLELKERINQWTARMATQGLSDSVRPDVEREGSMNALIRRLVRENMI